jgi:hypothetical protein
LRPDRILTVLHIDRKITLKRNDNKYIGREIKRDENNHQILLKVEMETKMNSMNSLDKFLDFDDRSPFRRAMGAMMSKRISGESIKKVNSGSITKVNSGPSPTKGNYNKPIVPDVRNARNSRISSFESDSSEWEQQFVNQRNSYNKHALDNRNSRSSFDSSDGISRDSGFGPQKKRNSRTTNNAYHRSSRYSRASRNSFEPDDEEWENQFHRQYYYNNFTGRLEQESPFARRRQASLDKESVEMI